MIGGLLTLQGRKNGNLPRGWPIGTVRGLYQLRKAGVGKVLPILRGWTTGEFKGLPCGRVIAVDAALFTP